MITELTKMSKNDQFNYLFSIVRTHNLHLLTYSQIEVGIGVILNNVESLDELIDEIKSGKYDVINLAGKDHYRVSEVLVTYFRK